MFEFFTATIFSFRHVLTRNLGALHYDIKFIRLAQEIFTEDFGSPSFQHLLTQGYKAQP